MCSLRYDPKCSVWVLVVVINRKRKIQLQKGGGKVKNTELDIYSNEADIDVSKIPQSVINDLADLFYGIMLRQTEQRQSELKQMVL